MNNRTALLGLRPALPTDDKFRFIVYTSTRTDELAQWGWPVAQQNAFLEMQFSAQERSYRITFPEAARSLIYLINVPIGIVMVDRTPEEIRLVDLALLPEHQGKGFGRQVIETLQVEARIRHQPLRLQVLNNNRARGLYERLGFKATRTSDLYTQMEWRGN